MKKILIIGLLFSSISLYSQNKILFQSDGNTYWEFDKYRIRNYNSGNSIYFGNLAGTQANDSFAIQNIIIGNYAGYGLTNGRNNIGIGIGALWYSNSSNNIAIGAWALPDNQKSKNVAIGDSSGYLNNGLKNVLIGNSAGFNNLNGSHNVMVGYQAGYHNLRYTNYVSDYSVFLGYKAGYNETRDHQLYIANSDTDKPLIGGDFALKTLDLNGHVRINDNYRLPKSAPAIGSIMMNTTSYADLDFSPYVFPTNQGDSKQILKLSNSGLLTWQEDKYIDGDSDPANEMISGVSLSGNFLNIFEGSSVFFADLSPLAGKWESNANDLYYSGGNVSVNNGLQVQGNLNVGTATNLGKMHIHDENNTLASIYLTPKSNNNSSMLFLAEDPNANYGMYWKYNGSANYLELWGKEVNDYSGPHIKVQRSTGQVAIGNKFDSDYHLSVDGKISCEEIKIEDSGGWPDFVFDKNYQLQELKEVKKFIEKEKHLPDLPSAKEINGLGYSAGAMIEKLLQKIEELTLHTIRQQEEIDALKESLSSNN